MDFGLDLIRVWLFFDY